MNQREPRIAAGLPRVSKPAQVAGEPDEHAFLALGVEFGAQVLEVTGAVDEAGFGRRAHAQEAAARKLGSAFGRETASLGDARRQQFLAVDDDRREALMQLGRHPLARKRLGRALVLLPLQRLRLDLQLVQRAAQKDTARGHAQHRHERVGIGQDFACAAGNQILAHAGAVALEQRDRALAGAAERTQQCVQLIGGGKSGFQPRNSDDHSAYPGIASGALEDLAQIEERGTAAAAQLVKGRARRDLAHRTCQFDGQHGAARNPRRPPNHQTENGCNRPGYQAEPDAGFRQAIVDGEHAGSGHQRNQHRDSELASQ